MRAIIDFTPEQKKVFDIAMQIREYGNSTNQKNLGYFDLFVTTFTKVNLETRNSYLVYKFKENSFKNLLKTNAPEDFDTKEDDSLQIAFTVGMAGGNPKWNIPA